MENQLLQITENQVLITKDAWTKIGFSSDSKIGTVMNQTDLRLQLMAQKTIGKIKIPKTIPEIAEAENLVIELRKDFIEIQTERKKLTSKFDNAINDKNWRNLTNFERGILVNCLTMNFKELTKQYGNKLAQSQFILLVRALENIENQSLLFLIRDPRTNYIIDFKKCKICNTKIKYNQRIDKTSEYCSKSCVAKSTLDSRVIKRRENSKDKRCISKKLLKYHLECYDYELKNNKNIMFYDFQTRKNRLQRKNNFSAKLSAALKASSTFKLTMF